MKSIKTMILAVLSVSFMFSSCVKEQNEYKPAATPDTVEAYFATDAPSSYSLKDCAGSLPVKVHRAHIDEAMKVVIEARLPEEFEAPVYVSFDKGQDIADYVITYDENAIEEGKKYDITLVIRSEESEYGNDTYNFTASLPLSQNWEPISTQAVMVETFLGPYNPAIGAHTFECYVEKLEGKEIYRILNPMSKCTVGGKTYKNPYFDETASGDGIWPEEFLNTDDYYIIVDAEGDYYTKATGETLPEGAVYVPYQTLNFAWSYGEFFIGSWADYTPEERESYGIVDVFGSYDKEKKKLTFGDCMLLFGDYWGWSSDAGVPEPVLWLDKDLMVEDFSDAAHLGSSDPLFMGDIESMIFSDDGTNPVVFPEMKMRYDASYLNSCEVDEEGYPIVEEGTTTTYYIADYYGEGTCVAFIAPAPEILADGDEITDVVNEQDAHTTLLGQKIFFKVKKGSVAIEDEESFPVFTLVINLYGKDAEGNVVSNFGNFTEVFSAYDFAKDGYTIDDVYGGYFEDYLGTWVMHQFDLSYGGEYTVDVEITDAGGGCVNISGLSGYDFEDSFIAEWSDYVLYCYPQETGHLYVYEGVEYPILLKTVEPETGGIYDIPDAFVIGGICSDGALAFVSPYPDINLSGFGWESDELGGLAYVSDLYGFPSNASGDAYGKYKKMFTAPVDLTRPECGKKMGKTAVTMKKVAAPVPYRLETNANSVRRINLNAGTVEISGKQAAAPKLRKRL